MVVERGDRPGVAGGCHEARHAARRVREGAPDVVVIEKGFGDPRYEPDPGSAYPAGDRGTGRSRPGDGGGTRDGGGPVADPVEPRADDLPHRLGRGGHDDLL